jgi:hypothetical protein
MKQVTLARIIERDLLATEAPRTEAAKCFACGRSHMTGDGRFCSTRCRSGFDAGLPAYDPGALAKLERVPLEQWRTSDGTSPWEGIIEASFRKRRKLAKRERAQNVKIRALKSMAYKRENAGMD